MGRNDETRSLREQLLRAFAEGSDMGDEELLTLALTYSEKCDVPRTVRQLLDTYGSLAAVCDADPRTLMRSFDVSESTAVLLRLVTIISRDIAMERRRIKRLDSPETAKRYFSSYFIGASAEHFAAAALGKDMTIKAVRTLAVGDYTGVEASNRDIVAFALDSGTDVLIIAHCHPLGSCEPSDRDISATAALIRLLGGLGITLADHIITGAEKSLSMRERTDIFPELPEKLCGQSAK
jgi:DNA repair protein RadC